MALEKIEGVRKMNQGRGLKRKGHVRDTVTNWKSELSLTSFQEMFIKLIKLLLCAKHGVYCCRYSDQC